MSVKEINGTSNYCEQELTCQNKYTITLTFKQITSIWTTLVLLMFAEKVEFTTNTNKDTMGFDAVPQDQHLLTLCRIFWKMFTPQIQGITLFSWEYMKWFDSIFNWSNICPTVRGYHMAQLWTPFKSLLSQPSAEPDYSEGRMWNKLYEGSVNTCIRSSLHNY